ncbi:hypothetical protein ACS0TY_035902 [Phlomoides rotata]
MSQSSGNPEQITCYCHRVAVTVTSWKEDNVGRRFLGCERYPNKGYCKFFKWIDEQLCERAKQIIPGLLKRLNEQRDEKRNMESVIDKLEEMRSIMQSVNDRLEVENRALKNENRALKKENIALKVETKKARIHMLKLMLWIFVVLGACCLIKIECNSGINMKMIG